MTKSITGTLPALATPFTHDGENIDLESYENLVEFTLSAGVTGVVVAGSSGEAATLSDEEYRILIEATLRIVKDRVPVIAGIGTNSTKRACEVAQYLRKVRVEGFAVDSALLVAPPYNKPSQEGIIAHFEAVAVASGLPLIAYNIPGRSAVPINPSTIAALAASGTIYAVKEASGSLDNVLEIWRSTGGTLSILSGEDSLVHSIMASGGVGVISASSNLIPEGFVAITTSALGGKYSDSLAHQIRILPLVRALFSETNPVPLKSALAMKKIIKSNSVRLPLLPARDETTQLLRALLV